MNTQFKRLVYLIDSRYMIVRGRGLNKHTIVLETKGYWRERWRYVKSKGNYTYISVSKIEQHEEQYREIDQNIIIQKNYQKIILV